MRNRIITLCVFFIAAVFIGGCSDRAGKSLCADFKAEFSAQYNGLSFGGSLLSTRQGNTNLTLSRPATLGNLELGIRNGELSLTRGRVSCTADEGYLPDSSFPSLLRRIFRGITDGRARLIKSNEENLVYSLDVGSENCEIVSDSEGLPQTISMEEPKLLLKLENVVGL